MLQLLRLAWPVILSYLALMIMGLVDLLFVGRVSPEAVGAVGIGTAVFSWFMMIGIGVLTGLDPLVSQAFGAGDREGCHRSFVQGLWAALWAGIPLTGLIFLGSYHLDRFGVHPDVVREAGPFLRILAFTILPVFLFTATRQYLQAMSLTKPGLVVVVIANLVNALVGYVLVFGRFGFPALGSEGAAWATALARVFMAVSILLYAFYWDRNHDGWFSKVSFALDRERMARLLRLGVPAALQLLFEVGVFALATVLAGRFRPVDLAAHQIVLNVASLTFMVPLGLGAAAAVLVGQSVGRGDWSQARSWGWRSMGLGMSFMAVSAVTLLVLPRTILGAYTTDSAVIEVARGILLLAALFQLSDGAQAVATGALRGLGETRVSAIIHFLGHWFVGLPLGVALGFYWGWGLRGLWVGLSVGLTAVAIALTLRWAAATRRGS
jgi:MATE family multidrug resistance protein